MKVQPHILVVDDEPNVRKVLRTLLQQAGCQATAAATGQEALDLVRSLDPDLVLTDLRMPGVDGIELLARLKVDFPEIPVVLLTAHATVETAVEAMRRGAHDFLAKPFTGDAIRSVIGRALAQAERRRAEYQGPLAPEADLGLVGHSPAMERLRHLLRRVGPTPSTALITGETGTGKELVAEALHALSPRRERPLVRINCGALPESLVESELFGHERGAFTGADRARPGRFELADGGTLFLDEVGELPAAAQVKLLRVLEDGRIDRVGSTGGRQVDVRVLAATHRDLSGMVAAGTFREDLLYRLRVIEVPVPPLRERTEDLPLLARFFLERHARRLGRPRLEAAPEALSELSAHAWPGNVRELENAVERALLLTEGLQIHSFLSVAGDEPSRPLPPGDEAPRQSDGAVDLKAAARHAARATERRLILAALRSCDANVTHAARILGLSRRGLQMKMKDLGIRAAG